MLNEFKGYDGQIELYENKIVIKREGGARWIRGFSLGDKEIYLKNLTGIQVKKPGMQAGYIQFIFAGSKEVKGSGIMKAANDENTVMFHGGNPKYQEALAFKQQVERLVEQASRRVENTPVSSADELVKFKQLLDAGAITQEEFENQKKDYCIPKKSILPQAPPPLHQTKATPKRQKRGPRRKGLCLSLFPSF